MQLITPHFTSTAANLDESAISAPTPALLAQKLAEQKAEAIAALHKNVLVIGCDTVVELSGKTLGKPANQQEAREMLTALAGKQHQVHTGVCLTGPMPSVTFVETTTVHFAPLSAKEIEAYIQTNEPYDKAGGYGIQGYASRFIPRIEGCYYNVMGLPVARLYRYLARLAPQVLEAP